MCAAHDDIKLLDDLSNRHLNPSEEWMRFNKIAKLMDVVTMSKTKRTYDRFYDEYLN